MVRSSHAIKSTREDHWRSRTSPSGWDTTREAEPTTCTENTEIWPPKVPSPSASETWVPSTEPALTRSKSWKSNRSRLASAEEPTSSNSTVPSSSFHCHIVSRCHYTIHDSQQRDHLPASKLMKKADVNFVFILFVVIDFYYFWISGIEKQLSSVKIKLMK